MTKQEFENARRNAVNKYMDVAKSDMQKTLGRNRYANAKRRLAQCEKYIEDWEQNGFWNDKNIRAYESIYKNSLDLDYVSAF